jgi:eukaryotic-like serine/threonine-protein kinase
MPMSSTSTSPWRAHGRALLDIGLDLELSDEDQRQIGPYRLLEKLGEGGLGIVWRAEQTQPVRREVALKLIKPGMHHSADVITRFEMERQALARMSHPNIACMLDAGTLADERPYFVMELVPGVPLTTFCKTHDLSRAGRIQLMMTLCQAVHHAHQKGILHRDLKPSNILVHQQDGRAVPKIIDFGIAKALDASDSMLTDPFFQTQIGAAPSATYPYMSPEQASRGVQALDTRSDIYTLGVILYELLTGKLPLPDEVLKSGRLDRVAAHILDIDPAPPSTHEAGLRGELDWITLRALERDPERRYESASALADDLRRHLENEPVSAGPPTALYRFQKWSRRHRVAFVSGSLVAASVCIGLIAVTTALLREKAALRREAAEHERADANLLLAVAREREAQSAREIAVKAKQLAESERNRAIESRQTADVARATAERLLNDILFDLRDDLEPIGRLSLLEPISRSAETYFKSVPASADNEDQQRNRAVMFQSRGSLLLAQGKASAAKESFEQSLSILQQRVTEQPQNAQRLHDLALGLERLGTAHEVMGDLEAAGIKYQAMLGLFDQLRALPQDQSRRWLTDAALPHERLGDLCRLKADFPGAMRHFTQGRDMLLGLGEQTEVTQKRLAVLEEKLGVTEEATGNLKAAKQHYEAALKLTTSAKKSSSTEAAQAILHGRLAKVSVPDQALHHAALQVETFSRLTTQDPLNLLWKRQHATALQQLGAVQEVAGSLTEAIASFRQALDVLSAMPDTGDQAQNINRERAATHLRIAAALFKAKSDQEAKEQAREALRCMSSLEITPELQQWKRTAEALISE